MQNSNQVSVEIRINENTMATITDHCKQTKSATGSHRTGEGPSRS